jgi:hypothetical protein
MIKLKFKNTNINIKNIIKINLIILLISLISTYLPLIYAYNNLGPARASFPFIFILNITLGIWAFILGLKSNFNSIFNIVLLVGVISIYYFSYNQYYKTLKFSICFDNRIKFIKNNKFNNQSYILVAKLPDSGVLVNQEVQNKNKHFSFTTFYLGRVVGVNKNIYLKETINKSPKDAN